MSMKINEERRTKLVDVLADLLNRLCERNDRLIRNNTSVTRFHALRPPQITIKLYLERIAKYSSCSEECFVLALIYIDRLIRKNRKFLVNSLNVHRLMITSIMLGAKFFDDQYFNNAYFGKVGGVNCKEMNLLEVEFLFMINFNLFVETDMYNTYNERLMNHAVALENTGQKAASPRIELKEEICDSPAVSQAPTTSADVSKSSTSHSLVASHQAAVGSPPASTAPSGIRQQVKCSTPVTPSVAVPKARQHFSAQRRTQRCTPPSPKFLKTNARIHMEMH